ncbi:MAG: hypothetical protein IT244_10740 [Bacteroidia bacterium]|nr:hypothetical protein [Bacteroidia bacterium]
MVNLNLIEGKFEGDEAKDILMNVFLTKIHFHAMKNFTKQELTGKIDENAKSRIQILRKELEKAMQLVNEAKAQNKKLRIHSNIQLEWYD